MTDDLFAQSIPTVKGYVPLAEQLRPTTLEDVLGQPHLLEDDGAPLTAMRQSGQLVSLIFWGPPGSGKTTLARLLADAFGHALEAVSAVTTGVAALKKICDQAVERQHQGRMTVLFVDEIHRFNRAQQDVFLPFVESGAIILIGATTENPSFELNAALLSRCRVLTVKPLNHVALLKLLERAESHLGQDLPLTEAARQALVVMADGDGRYLLGMVEQLAVLSADTEPLDEAGLRRTLQQRLPVYDKQQDSHYNLISAVHKALRGSDTDAALYWTARMMLAGESPHYLLRRLTRFAVEDIGLADPQALQQAISAWQAYDYLGSPEGDLAITQLVVYLGTAPKSNAQYKAHKAAYRIAKEQGSLMPPMHAVNAPTKLMKEQGYSAGYRYDHDTAEGCAGLNYFPDSLPRQRFYQPQERGFEREVKKRLHYWDSIRQRVEQAEEAPT